MLRLAISSHLVASTGSWNDRVWVMTPVETLSWAMPWPMPSCGRMADAIRNGSVYQDARA